MADQDARNQFDAAVAAVKKTPADLDTWDRIEELTEELNCSEEVAALYKEVLAQDLPVELILSLGERAANFFEEWFGDDPTALQDVLIRILEVEPEADWAFQRLTVTFSVTERWDDMLALYDRAIEASPDQARRIQLLEEAAQVAKDVANLPDQAITYMQKLVPLKPGDTQLESSLERLLERYERWADLISLWEGQLSTLSADEREQSRVRIAACWLDNLSDPARALEAVRPLLAEAADDKDACGLLERIITDKEAAASVRSSALDLLRLHYESTERPREVVRVLEAAIEMASPEDGKVLREEAGSRLAALEDDLAAMNHYAALLAIDPALSSIQEKMHELARRSSNFARYAEGVAAAAEACDDVPRKVALLAEAARVRLDMLEDEESAIRFYQAALALDGLEPEEEHRVARRLSELLARANRLQDRLDVLDRLARTDPNPSSRRNVIGEAARLAEGLGETDRALGLWKSRIDEDPDDLFALDAMIGLLEKGGRWQQLIATLTLRVQKTLSDMQRRADLVRIASIHDKELDAPEQAIEAWLRVQTECGENAETVDALADLYGRTERWSELVALLERASGAETGRVVERLVRLADAYRMHLDAPDRALAGYRNALAIDTRHEGAREGMTALLEVESCRAAAAETLAELYRRSGEWAEFVSLLEPRLAQTKEPRQRLLILREAAEIQEREVNPAAALESLARALPLAPRDQIMEGQMARLAAVTGHWQWAVDAYEQAIAALSPDGDAAASAATPAGEGDAHEVARLRLAMAKILDKHLNRREDAYAAFLSVARVQPGNADAAGAVVRLGTRLGRWGEVAPVLLGFVRESNRIDPALMSEIESVAADAPVDADAFGSAAEALSAALEASGETLPARLAFALHLRIAAWHRDRRNDTEASRSALRKASTFQDAPDADRAQALRELVAIDRDQPGRELFDTLRRLIDLAPGDLEALREAAEVALEHLDSPGDIQAALAALLGRASSAWRAQGGATADSGAAVHARWALDRLVDHHLAQGDAAAAVDLLGEGARLPFDQDTRRTLRLRAADIASDKLGDRTMAIQVYQALLSQSPGDLESMAKLADLYEAEGLVAEKLSLRRQQLGLEQDTERRIALRLEIAELVTKVEEMGGRLDALLANLDDQPGHPESIDALHALLDSRGEHARLGQVLEAQAIRLQESAQDALAAGVWLRLARVAEEHTKEIDRAIHAYRRVVDLSSTREALSALARLYMERKQPAQAVPWFENLLAGAAAEERQDLVLQLAQAHLGADQLDRAVACLESNLDDENPALPLRSALVDLYRSNGTWEPLARLLTKSLPLLPDNDMAIAYAREAADIYSTKLDSPGKAIPALKKALSVVEGDRTLRTQLAIGLRVADRLDESAELLGELIEEFGRRRSPERAALHVELALVKQAQGQNDEALEQMELASKMDVGNARIQKQLAEMSRQTGRLAQAERTYRALLLVVRRQPPGDDVNAVGPSEVLYEMHKLAAEQGQGDQAKELLESALEAAVQSDAEVRRLRRSLLAHGEAETLLRALRMRLEASEAGEAQAELLADIAEVLDKHLGRADEALSALLDALQKNPTRADLHQQARAMAKTAGKSTSYVDTVKSIAESLRRREDSSLVAWQLMRAGEALEQDVGNMEGALELYQRVEALGERTAEAYFAIARVCGHLGKTEEQARVLEAMLQLAHSDEPSPAQIDALYRLAEIFIDNHERREQGIDLLEKAFSAEPRYIQAGSSLRIAAAAEPENDRIMSLYERVARSANDWQMLLDFLERRAQRADATPSQVREAVTVAVEHDQAGRAEALLSRAVEAARSSDEGVGGAVWALITLAETRMATGDLSAARDLVLEVADYAEADKLKRLALDLAERATAGHKPLAAEMYELLRERNPSDRQVWEPLITLYRETGDSERLQAVIATTLPTLVEPAERNALRMQQAGHFVSLDRHSEAVELLRDVLLDDPDHNEAASMLEGVLREQGDQQGLADFLWQRFEDAKERANTETIPQIALQLGALLDQIGSSETLTVYRDALAVAPESAVLVRAVLDRLDPEADLSDRAELMERLIGLEGPEQAVAMAMELSEIYRQLDDEYGVQRVLERGHKASPDHAELRQRLEAWYREREMWLPLADLMVADAERLADDPAAASQAVARLREAAAVHRDTIGDAGTASGILRRALALDPQNDNLVAELAASLTASGNTRGAVEAIGEALENGISGEARIDLLLLRSDLRTQSGEDEAAIADLEEAYGLGPERIRPQLISALDRRRLAAEQLGDGDVERDALLRLTKLLAEAGGHEAVRPLLMHWVERHPEDRESLYTLLDMDRAAADWDGVLEVCARLVNIEEGEGQVRAALGLAEAAENAGRPGDALQALEVVHEIQPDSDEIRHQLRRIYELSGEHRRLASVLLADGDHAKDDGLRYEAYRRAAEVFVYSLGDASAAVDPARKALDLRPEDHDATVLYADVLLASGQTQQVVDMLDAAIAAHKRRSPELAVLQQRMARVSAMAGDRENQLGWLKKAFDVDRKNGEIAAELAQVATEVGDYDLALKPLRAITLMDNPGPISRTMALLWEAKIEHARGNKAKAELWAKKALREDPDFVEAQEFLDSIS